MSTGQKDWRVIWRDDPKRGTEWIDANDRETIQQRAAERPGGQIEQYVLGIGWVPETMVADAKAS